jgi:hypothetical protein
MLGSAEVRNTILYWVEAETSDATIGDDFCRTVMTGAMLVKCRDLRYPRDEILRHGQGSTYLVTSV